MRIAIAIAMAMVIRATMVSTGRGMMEENPARLLHLIIKSKTLLKIPVPYVLFDSVLLFAGIPPARKLGDLLKKKGTLVLLFPLCAILLASVTLIPLGTHAMTPNVFSSRHA